MQASTRSCKTVGRSSAFDTGSFCLTGLESGVRYEVMVISGTQSGFPITDDDWQWYQIVLGEPRPPESKFVFSEFVVIYYVV